MAFRVLLLGATGTIGRATAAALLKAGNHVTCVVRPEADMTGLDEATILDSQVDNEEALRTEVFAGRRFDAVISCLASRTGAPKDARAIDYQANSTVLKLAAEHGVSHFVLLSAICVQKPKLAFQAAKLSFEAELQVAPLTWSIVRPTAYFKSLSGQVERVKAGKPFMVFGDGRLTACKPISNEDLAKYIVTCLTDPERQNRVLPIGGPGPALTPLDQAEILFRHLGRAPEIRHVPIALISGIGGVLGGLSKIIPPL
ncbi:MAG: NAD(P)H-binding protein, partial [Pseudomonadota bacterium]